MLDDLSGLGRRMPWTMAAFVVGGLAFGIPLTAGFVSKWYLILGALDKDWWCSPRLFFIVFISEFMSGGSSK